MGWEKATKSVTDVDGHVAPFGIALTSGTMYINGQESIAFTAYSKSAPGCYKKGTITE